MSENNKDPYRLNVVQPVCARCKHRADALMMDKSEPWRDWFCLATTKLLWREEYNPITGVTTPAKTGHDRCWEVNKGECAMFEQLPEPEPEPDAPADKSKREPAGPTPPPQTEPAGDTRPWWRRVFGGRS